MLKRIICLSAVTLGTPALALAAATEHHSPGLETLLLPAINFGTYFVLAVWLYRKYVAKIIRQRAVDVRSYLQKAAAEVADAEKERSLLEARQADLEGECEDLKRSYESNALKISESIISEARKQSQRIAQDSDRQVENEIAQAKKLVRQNIAKHAAVLARASVKGKLNAEVDRALRFEAIESVVQGEQGIVGQ